MLQCIVSHILMLYLLIFSMFQQRLHGMLGTCLFLTNTNFFFLISWNKIRVPAYPHGAVFAPSVFMSAIHILYFIHACASCSSIRFVKICFGLSKESILGSLSLDFFLYGAMVIPHGSYVRLRFLFLLFSTTSGFVFP